MVYGERGLLVKSKDEGVQLDKRENADQTGIISGSSCVEETRHLPPSPLELSEMGLSLIPIQSGEKRPPSGCTWEQFQECGTTTEQVEQWSQEFPDCNWAVLLGHASGLVALDVDSAKALSWVQAQGYVWARKSKTFDVAKALMPPWYSTGRGWQFLFRLPADLPDVGFIKPFPGVEIRSNRHYSVIPPSIHANGKAYQWQKSPESLTSMPYPPKWMLAALKGKSAYAVPTLKKKTPIQRGAVALKPVDRHKELAGFNHGLLKERGTDWLETSVFGKGYRNAAFFSLANIYKAAGLTERECERRLDQWRLNQTRPVYGNYPDKQSEPTAAFGCIWKNAYGLDLGRLTSIQNAQGETLSESLALQLIRAYPSKRSRSERVHKPVFESICDV